MAAFSPIVLALLLLCGSIPAAATSPVAPENLPREVVINGVELLLVSEGPFWYGFENGDRQDSLLRGRPVYRDLKIFLDAFYIAKYEARATDFKRYMETDLVQNRAQYSEGETDGCALRRDATGKYYLVEPERDLPITHLTWQLSEEFSRWMGFRLPTEVEWVKAARGTDKRMWPWGDEYPDDTFASYAGESKCSVMPVNAYSKGVSPYGAYNMSGNMYEYVSDWFNKDYHPALKDGQRNPAPPAVGTPINESQIGKKILKGGRWASAPTAISIYGRSLRSLDEPFVCFGVRFAVDAETVRRHLAQGTATVVRP